MEDFDLDVTQEVVQPEEAATDIGVIPTEVEEQEAAEPAQSAEENAHFADMRRKQELEVAKIEMRKVAQENQRLLEALKTAGFQGETLDIADQIEANQSGKSIDQLRYERMAQAERLQREREALKQSDPEYTRLKQQSQVFNHFMAEKLRADDLTEIKTHNPKETIKTVTELGELFGVLRVQGCSAIDAYEAVRALGARKQPPKSMGDIGGGPEEAPQDKYANMSTSDFEKEIRRAEMGELTKGRI